MTLSRSDPRYAAMRVTLRQAAGSEFPYPKTEAGKAGLRLRAWYFEWA
jgi:hypothetical protein